jgi:hypothetical protein
VNQYDIASFRASIHRNISFSLWPRRPFSRSESGSSAHRLDQIAGGSRRIGSFVHSHGNEVIPSSYDLLLVSLEFERGALSFLMVSVNRVGYSV